MTDTTPARYVSTGPSPDTVIVVHHAAGFTAERGHYCPFEYRGEKCPGPDGCSVASTPANLANVCDKNGLRDGVRCLGCGRWGETESVISHKSEACVEVTKPLRQRRGAP